MNFLPWFKDGAGSFLCQKFSFLKYRRFHLSSELYHYKKNFAIFLHFKATITHLFIDITTLEILFSYLVFREDFAKFLFLFTMPEKQKSTMSECLKFTGSIYRILNSQKTISLANVSLKEKFNFNFRAMTNIFKSCRFKLKNLRKSGNCSPGLFDKAV